MEGRVGRNVAQVSPERFIVWTEPSGKHCMQRQQGTKVPVVYYLCKNSLLEHPHFIEVPFSSPEGLYLRDVISRLVVLRGHHMPTMYSWSCKRSYRNGFVWQDLAEDDLIIPAQGNDYILKGSLLLNEGSSDGFCLNKSNNNLENLVNQQNEHSLYSRNEEASTMSSVTTMREVKPLSPIRLPSPVMNSNEIQPKDVQANEGLKEEKPQILMLRNARMGTLVSLIRAEVENLNRFKVAEGKGLYQSKVKIKRTNALMQLFSCGSILKKVNIS